MKRKIFRILLMAAVLAALVGLLACGGSATPQTAAPEPTAAPATTAAPAAPAATAPSEAPTATTETAMAMPAPTAMGESCAPSADLTFDDRPPQGGTLVRLFADPPTLDPHLMGDVTSSVIGGEVFGGLVTLSLDYQPVLDLAETCSISEDGLVYTFVLRENAKFHDGKPVTAQDVKWSIERAADPDTLSHTAETYLGDIVGAKEKLDGTADEVSGVRVVDDRTIEFTIDAPKSYFLAKLTYPTAYVVDQEQVNDDGTWLEEPNGTGPFKLATYEIGELIVLERNENYHLGPPHIESVQMILSGGSAMIMYENDEIHLTGVGLDDLPRLLDPNDALHPQLHRSPQDFDVFYIGLNVAEPPFDDAKVRQALNYAIDLQSIAENVLDGRVSPATGVIPPGFPSYTENLRSYHFNPDLARELMQESKYGDALASGDFPRITLTISGSFGAAIPTYLEVILEQWRQELGIEVEIQQTEWATFLQDVNDKKYQMFSLGWIADYPDPQNFLDVLLHSESQSNHTNYGNPEVDRLLEEARTERDRARRFELYNQIEQMILDDAPWVWTWFSGEGYALIKPEVSDYFLLQMSIPKYRYVYFNQ
ncbi:MAG: peptide ABC transporter substrate-binding protein [Chloroflexota bacterium]|nr:peptide ABC transporter substrate-binding protein [Chloroflexota bacterium]MDE2961592.1 peptide ABC transporter substrate-binding protein [Chloroflexota bacterium]